MGARLRRRIGVDHRRLRSPNFIFFFLGGMLLWELWEEGLRQPRAGTIRPRDVDVVFFEDHLVLEPRRKLATVPFSHYERGDEVGNLGPRPVVPQIGVADGAATETVALVDPAPAARAALTTVTVMGEDGPA